VPMVDSLCEIAPVANRGSIVAPTMLSRVINSLLRTFAEKLLVRLAWMAAA
jgi:hypothetical protein